MADVVRAARDAGAAFVWTNVLYLRPGTREHFLEHLARDWPEQLPRYERLYRGRAYLSKGDIEPVRRDVAELRDRFGIGNPSHDAAERRIPARRAAAKATMHSRSSAPSIAVSKHPVQLSLALPPATVGRAKPPTADRGSMVSAA
jgi:hypothetical protein